MKTIALAFTGASGLPYGLRLLECLRKSGQRVWLEKVGVADFVVARILDQLGIEHQLMTRWGDA